MRSLVFYTLPLRTTAAQCRHVRPDSGFFDEHEPLGIEARLKGLAAPAYADHVRAFLLERDRFVLQLSPSACRKRQTESWLTSDSQFNLQGCSLRYGYDEMQMRRSMTTTSSFSDASR